MRVRYATAADIDAFFGSRPRVTITARVLEMDDKVVSVAGLAREGTCHKLFWDIAPSYENVMLEWRMRRLIVREIRALLARIAKNPVPVVACVGNHELLSRLGFEQIEGDRYLWLGKRQSHTS